MKYYLEDLDGKGKKEISKLEAIAMLHEHHRNAEDVLARLPTDRNVQVVVCQGTQFQLLSKVAD